MSNFSQNYSDSFDYIYRYVFIRVNNREITQDLVSKIFLEAFENQEKYDGSKGSWRQWITGIAKNSLLNYWRSHRKFIALEETELDHVHFENESLNPGSLSQKLQFERIMNSSSPAVQNLLIWRYVDDLTYEAIADLLHKTPLAVRKSFSRLHKQLKEKFEADLEV